MLGSHGTRMTTVGSAARRPLIHAEPRRRPSQPHVSEAQPAVVDSDESSQSINHQPHSSTSSNPVRLDQPLDEDMISASSPNEDSDPEEESLSQLQPSQVNKDLLIERLREDIERQQAAVDSQRRASEYHSIEERQRRQRDLLTQFEDHAFEQEQFIGGLQYELASMREELIKADRENTEVMLEMTKENGLNFKLEQDLKRLKKKNIKAKATIRQLSNLNASLRRPPTFPVPPSTHAANEASIVTVPSLFLGPGPASNVTPNLFG
jgi:hypothetical protein